jgi:hypothetical protein
MTEPHVRSLFSILPDEGAQDLTGAAADPQVVTDHVVPHTEVSRWLESWDLSGELSRPKPKPL